MKITKACKGISKINECSNTTVIKDTKAERTEACKHIQSAIECLGKIAECDNIAKDSIANLGVVMLDLDS